MLKVLVACEESQAVTKEFRALGHEAYSCDILPCSGGHPEWHIQGDARGFLNNGWDLLIAHPPCTYISRAGACRMYPRAGEIDLNRYAQAMKAKDLFMAFLNADIPFIAVENPIPLKIVGLPRPSAYVQPYEHGHPFSKKTLFWLKNLPALFPTEIVPEYRPYLPSNTGGKKRGQKFMYRSITQQESSKTFPGIAKAMATQWSDYILKNKAA